VVRLRSHWCYVVKPDRTYKPFIIIGLQTKLGKKCLILNKPFSLLILSILNTKSWKELRKEKKKEIKKNSILLEISLANPICSNNSDKKKT